MLYNVKKLWYTNERVLYHALSDMPWYNTSVLKNKFKKYMLQCGGMENNMKK